MSTDEGSLLIETAVKGIPKVFVVSALVSVTPAQPFVFRNYQVFAVVTLDHHIVAKRNCWQSLCNKGYRLLGWNWVWGWKVFLL
jgi:hypothetical protein